MIVYIFIFATLLCCYIIALHTDKKYNALLYPICFLPFAVLPGTRLDVGGSDYFIYESAYNLSENIIYFLQFEPGYNLLMLIFSKSGFSFNDFLFIVTAISSFFLFEAIKKITNFFFLGLLIYLAKLYIFYNFVLIRQMIAIPFVWIALYYLINQNNRKFFIFTLIAFLFHFSAFVLFFVFFIRNLKWTIGKLLTVLSICALFGFLSSIFMESLIDRIPLIGDKLSFYLKREQSINPLNLVETFGILFLATYYKSVLTKKIRYYSSYYNLLVVFTIILLAFYNIDVFKRVRDYFIVSYVVILPCIIMSTKGISKYLIFIFMILYLLFLYIRSIAVFDTTTGGIGNLIPYKNLFML
jgi:hypothetical protein